MKMKKLLCDKCGEPIDTDKVFIKILYKSRKNIKENPKTYATKHVCYDCLQEYDISPYVTHTLYTEEGEVK